MPTQRYSKWPDFLEVELDEEGQVQSLTFVCVRKNSRAFQVDQLNTLQALEHAGKVVVRVGTQDLTIDEFERQGAFQVDIAPKLIAQSTYYNKKAELKRYEKQLHDMDIDDPEREGIWLRVQRLRQALGLEEEGKQLDQAIETGKQGLNRLAVRLQKEEIIPDYSDEELLKIPWPTLAKIKEPEHSILWKRKGLLLKQLEQGDNNVTKSSTTSQDQIDRARDVTLTPIDSITPIIESD